MIKRRNKNTTPEQRAEVVRLSLAGKSVQQIAKISGVNKRSVYRILDQRKEIINSAKEGVIVKVPREVIVDRMAKARAARKIEQPDYVKSTESSNKRGPRGPYKTRNRDIIKTVEVVQELVEDVKTLVEPKFFTVHYNNMTMHFDKANVNQIFFLADGSIRIDN